MDDFGDPQVIRVTSGNVRDGVLLDGVGVGLRGACYRCGRLVCICYSITSFVDLREVA